MEERRLQRRANGSRSAVAARLRPGSGPGASPKEIRAALAARLRQRLPEIEVAVATRAQAISDPSEVADPAYMQRLVAASRAAIDHRLEVLEAGEAETPAVPAILLAQARLEARDGVSLDTVLRRYVAGNALFGDFLVEEAERAEIPASVLRRLLAAQATLGDRLLAAVSTEYAREEKNRPRSAAERRRQCVKALLAGELVDCSELGYDLDAHHLAVLVKGAGAEELVGRLAAALERRLLAVQREEEPIWACWLGGRRPLSAQKAVATLSELVPEGTCVLVGEPGEGLPGWRFSHRQAKAALPIAEREGKPVLRYADVALLAAIARDDLVASSLRQLYLAPLERERDGGRVARETLRAYFASGRNGSSTAAALGVDRRTVTNRVRAIEELLGLSLKGSVADLEVALRLDE